MTFSSPSSSSTTGGISSPVKTALFICIICLLVVLVDSSLRTPASSSTTDSKKTEEQTRYLLVADLLTSNQKRPPLAASPTTPTTNSAVSRPPSSSSTSTSTDIVPHQHHVQRRYEPTPWKRGVRLPVDTTPLTMIKNNQTPRVELPKDWDGGYGWVFVKYHPSPYEARWRQAAVEVEQKSYSSKATPLCDLQKAQFSKEEAAYVKEMHRMPADNGGNEKCTGFPAEPMKFDDEIFSKFEYEFKCTRPPCKSPPPLSPRIGEKKFTYIEPLVSLLRHPRVCADHRWLVNKNYMVVDPWSLVNPSRSTISPEELKVMYFDLGASTWDQGAGGASQSWFHKVYEGKCLNFTDWFMYEATKHDPKNIYKLLPGHIKSGYRWQNIFLQADAASWDNPLNALLMEARKEDVVIFKIDFDTTTLENTLIQQIIDHPEVADLIDDLYFEHHVNLEILRGPWGSVGKEFLKIFHSDSLRVFTQLRERGIRAHSWV